MRLVGVKPQTWLAAQVAVLIQVVFMAGVLVGRAGPVELEEMTGGGTKVEGTVDVVVWAAVGVVGVVGTVGAAVVVVE